jgi:hypothetical protein
MARGTSSDARLLQAFVIKAGRMAHGTEWELWLQYVQWAGRAEHGRGWRLIRDPYLPQASPTLRRGLIFLAFKLNFFPLP